MPPLTPREMPSPCPTKWNSMSLKNSMSSEAEVGLERGPSVASWKSRRKTSRNGSTGRGMMLLGNDHCIHTSPSGPSGRTSPSSFFPAASACRIAPWSWTTSHAARHSAEEVRHISRDAQQNALEELLDKGNHRSTRRRRGSGGLRSLVILSLIFRIFTLDSSSFSICLWVVTEVWWVGIESHSAYYSSHVIAFLRHVKMSVFTLEK